MRFTIRELTKRELSGKTPNPYFEQGLKWPEGIRRVEATATGFYTVDQPADPFRGQGDFEYHPAVVDLARERRLTDFLNKRVMIAGVGLANVAAILDRPLSKLKNKDLIVLIRAAQDAVADAKEQMG